MKKTLRLLLYLFFVSAICINVSAQRPPFDNNKKHLLSEATEFYGNENYDASIRYLEDFLASSTQASSEELRLANYYLSMASYKLRKKDAKKKLLKYIETYPYATHLDLMELYIGIIEFEAGKYKQAIRAFEKIQVEKLEEEEALKFYFYRGYAYHKQESYKKSAYEFEQIFTYNENKFTVPAHYYYGYAQYRSKNYHTALEHLSLVQDVPEFKKTVLYLICQSYFQEGNCEKTMSIGKEIIKKYPKKKRNNNRIYHIMGSCSFANENYAEALTYLEAFKKGNKRITREDWYALGISYYMTGNYNEAIIHLTKSAIKEDRITQSSYYHLGMSFLKFKDMKNARMAFEAASRYAFDPEIEENALYNYALVTYEISFSPFNESVVAFERFLEKFPTSTYKEKVYEYLLNVYLSTKNYAAAYNSIQKVETNSPVFKEAEQRILFGMGTTNIANRQYTKASKSFKKVLENKSYDNEITARSNFWYGECLYRMRKYKEAKKHFEIYLKTTTSRKAEEYNLAHYNLGYVCAELNQTKEANLWFRKFVKLEKTDKRLLLDAYSRIGDSYFINREFELATNNYTSAYEIGLKIRGADYARYQCALVKGLQKRYEEKVIEMNQLITMHPNSAWKDDAMFEIGRAYVAMKENDKAIANFKKIEAQFKKKNPIVPKAKLEIAMIQQNTKQNEAAAESYKDIIRKYPNTEEAETSLLVLESMMVDENKVEEYSLFTKEMGKTAPSKEDSLSYKAAQKIYFKNDAQKSIDALAKYIKNYPKGKYNCLARYYLANSYYLLDKKEEALSLYQVLIKDKENPNLELSLARASEISYDLKKLDQASQYFEQLEVVGDKEHQTAAQVGALRTYFTQHKFDKTIEAAKKLLNQQGSDAEIEQEAHYKRMKSHLALGNEEMALPDLQVLSTDTRTAYGAEAKYLLAKHYFTHSEAEKAEKEIFDYIEKGTPHSHWLAQSFVLLADIYLQKGNYYEAKQYLLSLQTNYTAEDAVIKEAIATRLNKIEKMEEESVAEDAPEEINEDTTNTVNETSL